MINSFFKGLKFVSFQKFRQILQIMKKKSSKLNGVLDKIS